MLSVLVVCVAVVEALAVGRRVGLCVGSICGRASPDLSDYTRSVREKLKKAEVVEDSGDEEEDVKSWSTWSTPGATPQEEFLRNLDGISRTVKRDSGSRKRRSFRSRKSGECEKRESISSVEAIAARKKLIEEELRALTALEEIENAPANLNIEDSNESQIVAGDENNEVKGNVNVTNDRSTTNNDHNKEAFWVKNDV